MKKILATLLSLALALTLFAACGKTEKDGDDVSVAPVIADPGGSDETTEPPTTEPTTTTTEATTEDNTPKAPEGAAEILEAYAAAVDKSHAANFKMAKHCKTTIKKPLEGDNGILKLLKISIAGINVQNAVCDILGEGDSTWHETMQEGLQKSHLRVDDVTSATATIDDKGAVSLTINIKNCTNPLKLSEGGSPIGRFTWDFANIKTTDEGIAGAQKDVPGLRINIAKKNFNYYNIKITATISPDGVFTHLVHSYNYTARVEDVEVKMLIAKLGGGKWGQGTATGTITYNI